MMRLFKTTLGLAFMSFLLIGCSALNSKPLDTESGRPEILISSSQKTQFITEISNKMLDKGYTLLEENDSKLVFEKENYQGANEKITMGVLLGSQDSRERVIFNFLPKNSQQLRVMAEVLYVNANREGGNSMSARRQFYPEWQKFLDGMLGGNTKLAGDKDNNAINTDDVDIDNDKILKAQQKLKALGYSPGSADGVMGDKTKRAIAIYQLDKGLDVTKKLDTNTLKSLGIAQ